MNCDKCHKPIVKPSESTTGYGLTSEGKKLCYTCCGEIDRQQMRDTGKISLYLVDDNTNSPRVCNWPDSLSFPVRSIRKSSHNWAGIRRDFWFTFEDQNWHGVQYGENTQIAHCKRAKA